MNNIGMTAMNAAGGSVSGMPMMNNGMPNGPRTHHPEETTRGTLNTYIYDYFLKNELWDCARALYQSEVAINLIKVSPGLRRDADGNPVNNGVDDSSMDADVKEESDPKRPEDLPIPRIPGDLPQNSLLQDWWCLFWDIFSAQRRKLSKPSENSASIQYLQFTQQQQRLRQEQSQQLLRQMNPAMLPNQYQTMIRLPNGMTVPQNELPRKAMQNSTRNPPPQQMHLAKNQQQYNMQQQMQQQMQRDNSNMGMNGDQRPQSPSSADNAPSPSKRPRLENGTFNGQPMGPTGRGQPQGMPGQPMGTMAQPESVVQAQRLLLQNGINPAHLSPQQFHSFQSQNPAMQQKSLEMFTEHHGRLAMNNASMAKGMPTPGGAPGQASPMMHQVSDGQAMNDMNMSEYYAGNASAVRMPGPGPGSVNATGRELQDYQMQLMILEQQNKRRLILARQENDGVVRADPNALNAQQGGFQGMSPQGPRPAPSPNPQEQMNKRGSPKMNNQVGMPGSPLPDGGMPKTRGSPAAMGIHSGQVPHGMAPGFIQEMNEMKPGMVVGGPPNGVMMRPPSSHPAAFNGQPLNPQQQLEALARQQASARMQQGQQNWQQVQQAPQMGQGPGPMMQQPHPGQAPQQVGTPQQRNAMPPPQALPNTNGNGRTQPSSPQQNPAPPTPQQANKPNPKPKKESKGGGKRPIKKGSTSALNAGATPTSEAEPPPTPTPSTPITPVHPQSFAVQKGQNPGPMAVGSQAPTSAPASAPQLAQPPPEGNPMTSYGGTDGGDAGQFSLDFASMDSSDVLGSFDFDAFLHTDDAGAGAALNFDLGTSSGYGGPDGVEAGAGDV